MVSGSRLFMTLSLFPIFLWICFFNLVPSGWFSSPSVLISIVTQGRNTIDMAWPWKFVTLSEEDQAARRHLLDKYGVYAQLSTIVPVLAYLLCQLYAWLSSKRQRVDLGYEALSSRANYISRKGVVISSNRALKSHWRSFVWWQSGDIYGGWGARGIWVIGLMWSSWLLFLSIHQTGDDYLHVTKRFGVVGASQFPLHYMLSMKSSYSPFAIVFRSSHEQLNPYHRILGRIIYFFLVLHFGFYINFFVQAGLLKARLTQLVPLLGILAFMLLTVLATTSLARIRRWSYRVFFVPHLFVAVSVLPILFFHAKPIRVYLIESMMVFVLDIIARKVDTFTGFSKITQIADTKLLKLIIPIPPSKTQRFRAAPGQHVYLSLPPESTPTTTYIPSVYDLMYNPFTVADVSSDKIMLILRTLHGPTTTALQRLTKLDKAKPGINIEGPYGDTRRFPNLAVEFDRILLVAGGVGATFILPIFNHVVSTMNSDEHNENRLRMIWSLRSMAEASWVKEMENPDVLADPRVKTYVTGTNSENLESPVTYPGPEDGSVVMGDLHREEQPGISEGGYMRPNLESIVDMTFQEGAEERIAVIVCGPTAMAQELREHVGRWVSKGRDVWWHNESFGW